MIMLDPNDDEAPPTPGLLAATSRSTSPADGEVSGLFTEDQLREASIDLDQITRGNVNPFAAMLTINKNAQAFQPMTPLMPAMRWPRLRRRRSARRSRARRSRS